MQVVSDSPFSLAWIPFPIRPPAQTLVLVVKATFDLVPSGPCPISETQPLVTGDLFWDDDVERPVRWDSDLAIAKPRGEWWLTGLWKASASREATHALVEVGVGDQTRRVAIIGDRWWPKGILTAATPPRPLAEVPLGLHRAFGGPGHRGNPFGLGLDPDPEDPDKRVRLPNLEDPNDPIASASDRPDPAGGAPRPRTHPDRMALTGTYSGDYMSTRWPYYPADFQWSHFLAAPPAQQMKGFFRGDERIRAEALHPDLPRSRCELPGLAPRVFLAPVGLAAGAPLTPVSLALDTLVVDATDATVSAVWRGHVEGVAEDLSDIDSVFLVHEPRTAAKTPAEYRAWYDHKRAEADAEDDAFEAEPIPEDAPDPEPEPEVEPELPEPEAPPDPIEVRREELRAQGVPEDLVEALAPNGPPAPPPDPAERRRDLEAALEAARGLASPQMVSALEAELAAEDEPEPEAAADEADDDEEPEEEVDARQRVQDAIDGGQSLAGLSFFDADLSGIDFSKLDLHGITFVRCVLAGCRFRESTLDDAVFDGCVLHDAVFDAASMAGSRLDRAVGERVSFRGALLEDAHAERAQFPAAQFLDCKAARSEWLECVLCDAVFDAAVLDEADLSGSNLQRARFVGASLVDCWLSEGVNAQHAEFEGANLRLLRASESDFADAGFKWVTADEARFGRARLDRANFSFADLMGADFADASCLQTIFLAVRAKEAVFDRAQMLGVQLGRSDLMGASFMQADLHHADLRGANLFGAELFRARVDDAQLELANLQSTKLEDR